MESQSIPKNDVIRSPISNLYKLLLSSLIIKTCKDKQSRFIILALEFLVLEVATVRQHLTFMSMFYPELILAHHICTTKLASLPVYSLHLPADIFCNMPIYLLHREGQSTFLAFSELTRILTLFKKMVGKISKVD